MRRGTQYVTVVDSPDGHSWQVRARRAGLVPVVPGPLWFLLVPLDVVMRRLLFRDQWRVTVQTFPQALSRKKVFSCLAPTERDAEELVDGLAARVAAGDALTARDM